MCSVVVVVVLAAVCAYAANPVFPDVYSSALTEQLAIQGDTETLGGYLYVSLPTNQIRIDLATFGTSFSVFWDVKNNIEYIVTAVSGNVYCSNSSAVYPALNASQHLKYDGAVVCFINGTVCDRYVYSYSENGVSYSGDLWLTRHAVPQVPVAETIVVPNQFAAAVQFFGYSPSIPSDPSFMAIPPICLNHSAVFAPSPRHILAAHAVFAHRKIANF